MNHSANSHCGDCKQASPKLFMVQDDLWVWHIAGPDLLCIHCAEQRLGRPFQKSDFKLCSVNNWVFKAFASGLWPATWNERERENSLIR